MDSKIDRRRFLAASASGFGALSALTTGCGPQPEPLPPAQAIPGQDAELVGPRPLYNDPKKNPYVILVRFGGGVRRRETIDRPEKTWCPFIRNTLATKGHGLLFNNLDIASNPGVQTNHGHGTLYLLTGQYDHYQDIARQAFAARFEAKIPTVFEYLRRYYDVPAHQALIINGEDRIDEEFYTFSNHHLYGASYRSTVLSLFRYKAFLLRDELASNKSLGAGQRAKLEGELSKMEKLDYRDRDDKVVGPELNNFWSKWKEYYGRTGLVNPRGDRVLTALALRSIKYLRPKLMMINYQDPDYVHWGNRHHYTRAISIIDEGVREIYQAVQADEEYRDRTVFVIVPDCGRDNNRLMDIPFQHHFNSKTSHEIFAVVAGPKDSVPQSDHAFPKLQQQISIASTIGELMKFPTPHCTADSLLKLA